MVDVTPQMAFIAALQGQFNASRQGGGGPIPGIPGLSGTGGNDPANTPGLPGGLSGGITAGGVPSTATTGTSVANALIGGGGGADALSQQVGNALRFDRGPTDRSGLRPGVAGGDLNALLSILGGPGAIATLLGSLVASDAAGLPPDPSLLTTTGLLNLSGEESSPGVGSRGIAFADRDTGRSSFSTDTGNALSSPATNIGSLGISRNDRERFGPGSPGRSANRGTGLSNAGR